MQHGVKKRNESSQSLIHQGFVADKMLLFGSQAILALELWIWGEEGKVCIFCTNSVWFMEKLLGVADCVFCSTAVNIQGLGKELGSKDNNVFGDCIPN